MNDWMSEWMNSQWGLGSYVSLSLFIPPLHSPSNGFQGMALFIFPFGAEIPQPKHTPEHSWSTRVSVCPQSAPCVLFSLSLTKVLWTVINRHRWAKETFLRSARAVYLGVQRDGMSPRVCLQDVMTLKLPWRGGGIFLHCPWASLIPIWPNDYFSSWWGIFHEVQLLGL